MTTFSARITVAISLFLFVGLTGCQPLPGARTTSQRTVHLHVTDAATGQPVAGHAVGGFYADRIDVTAASRLSEQQTAANGKAELSVDLNRKPVLDAGGTRVSLDVKKLRAGETQVIETGNACACCNGEKHAARPLRVEVSCK